jgi:hypothetical protein
LQSVGRRDIARNCNALSVLTKFLGGTYTGVVFTRCDVYPFGTGFQKTLRHKGTESTASSSDNAYFVVHGK